VRDATNITLFMLMLQWQSYVVLQRFCMLDRKYVTPFQRMFAEQYDVIHRLETNKLRNVAKLFAHLLHTDAISWEVRSALY